MSDQPVSVPLNRLRVMPDGPGWWWVSENGNPPECVRVLVRRYSGEPDGFCVDDGDGPDVESESFDWLAPVLTVEQADALTRRAEQAEGDAARFERDLTALHGDYDALAVERDELRREVARLTIVIQRTHAILGSKP